MRPSGLIAIRLNEGDVLGWARLTQGDDELILVTEQGQGIRFNEQNVRAMGRTAMGVIAMRIAEGDRVALAEVVEPGGKLFLASRNGYGRCTRLDDFRIQGRGGKGVRAYQVNPTTGTIIDGRVVQDEDEVTLMSESGIILRTTVSRIPVMGRYSHGVHMMDLKEGDGVASIARLFNDQTEAPDGDGDEADDVDEDLLLDDEVESIDADEDESDV